MSQHRDGRIRVTLLAREPGTYRTTAGSLVHFRPTRDGAIVLEREDDRVRGKLGGEEDTLVKLSDDPNWPDIEPRFADPELFAD
jgi:hypothetical protein